MDVNHDNPAVVWAKTDAGRAEIQSRNRVEERAQRNLLLVVDGSTSAGTLLSKLDGISMQDFHALLALGLIAPAGSAAAAPSSLPAESVPLDDARFTAVLTRLISTELGLRGFMLTLAVEKARTTQELRSVAQRTLEQIGARRGEAAAEAARRALYGA